MTISREIREKVVELYNEGRSRNSIATELGISWDSVSRILKEHKVEEDKKVDDVKKQLKQIEYREELKEMLKEIETFTNIEHRKLKSKIEFLLEEDDIDDGIFKEIRDEFKSLGYLLPYEKLKVDYESLRNEYNTLEKRYGYLEKRSKDLQKTINYKNDRISSLDEKIDMKRLAYNSLNNRLASLQHAAVLPCPDCSNNIIIPYNTKGYMNLLELLKKNNVICKKCRDNKRFLVQLLSIINSH